MSEGKSKDIKPRMEDGIGYCTTDCPHASGYCNEDDEMECKADGGTYTNIDVICFPWLRRITRSEATLRAKWERAEKALKSRHGKAIAACSAQEDKELALCLDVQIRTVHAIATDLGINLQGGEHE